MFKRFQGLFLRQPYLITRYTQWSHYFQLFPQISDFSLATRDTDATCSRHDDERLHN